MKEFTITTHIKAAPMKVYESWLDSKHHAAMTGAAAQINAEISQPFSAWDGYISGRNLELEPGKRILQAWRTVEFSDDEPDSHIEILFDSEESGTLVTLRHWDLPEHGDQYESGWEDSYFAPMRKYFE